MSPISVDEIVLTAAQRRQLTRLARAGSTAQRLALRVSIVLLANQGQPNTQIARLLGICPDTAAKWGRRWCQAPVSASLSDAKRSGRPPMFTPVQVAQVKALACRPAADSGLPLSRWSCPELARQVITDRICSSISSSTVRRWLNQEALKPWQYQSWIFITDPNFPAKAQRVLDLYARQWEGSSLGPGDYVISSDEKPPSRRGAAATPPCHLVPPG